GLRVERGQGEHGDREKTGQSEPCQDERMSREAQQRAERIRREVVPLADERLDEPPIRAAVRAEPRRGRVDRSLEEHGRAVVERMRERDRWLDPLETILREIELTEERRGRAHRMERRAEI